ncbi:MAG TPA: MBOAT family O-acyltransferase [Acetobacteraceae bacterium]|nr:MBOAT family O-acyltransferase [Acetobacteraceae bacterium]
MTVASLAFLAFALAAALLYNLARPVWWRQGVLLIANGASLVTFAAGVVPLLPLLGFIAVSYACLWLVQRDRSNRTYVVALTLMIVLFFWLKRYSFLPQSSFLPFAYSVIGLSYIFFRTVHVVIDAHGGDLPERVAPIAYLNYVLNFTSLVSGPIQRYQDYAATQLGAERPPLNWIVAGRASERIATGLFKVVVLAAILNGWHTHMLAAFAAATTLDEHIWTALAATVGYTFYLYCNFSGYTDIVIGAARMYRLELPENFDRPFAATSFLDFWSRWHMTLSGWLKTYVYNPLVLALMARFPSASAAPFLGVMAYFVTFFLIGLWHGQTSVFAVYGVLLGLGVSVNKLYQVAMAARLGRKRYRALAERSVYQAAARGLTFAWFTISLVFFWGDWPVIGQLAAGLGVAGLALASTALVLVAGLVLTAGVAIREASLRMRVAGSPALRSRYCRTVSVTAMSAVAVAALLLLASPAPDVIYRTF